MEAGLAVTAGGTSEPGWVAESLFWQVYPLGALGAFGAGPARPAHLTQLIPWLDHLQELGCNGLLLGPIFASSTHGYDTLDHFRIDPRLGDQADFAELVAECQRRGVRLLLDGVFNHVGRDHPRLDALAAAERPVFEGHQGLVALDHQRDTVVDLVREVMHHWLSLGIDGWRLDAAYAVPSAFWSRVLPEVAQRWPEAYLLGEVIHGDYGEFVAASGMHAVTQYELWKAIWSSLNDANFFELSHALDRHHRWLASSIPLTFVGNHDVTRIASQLSDARHLPHAIALGLLVAGTPCLYYGDEIGAVGVKEQRIGGDDAIRPVLPADPAAMATLPHLGTAAKTLELTRRLVSIRQRHPWLHHTPAVLTQLTNTCIGLHWRTEQKQLFLGLALEEQPCTVRLPAGPWACLAGSAASVMATDAVHPPASGDQATRGNQTTVLPPHGWVLLEQDHA